MSITRTVVFPIQLTNEQQKSLSETIKLYTKAFKACVNVAWNIKKPSGNEVHKLTYKSLKLSLGLKSQYLCSSRNKAVETVKAMKALERRGKKVSKPKSERIPIRLDARTLSFDKPRGIASIATQHGRIKVPLVWHKHANRYRDWNCKAGEVGIDKKKRWVLRLIFEKEVTKTDRTGRVVGYDRGIKHAVVASNNRFVGNSIDKEHERRLLALKARLQSKGTKSARRHLKKLSGRLRRFKENCDRIVAKELMQDLLPGDTVVFEKLTNIRGRCGVKRKARKKHRAQMGRWSFKRLENAITYIAELKGIYVEYVEPHYTSQACSKCGIVLKKNRKTQSFYSCACGCKLNADLNAARNIANKWCIANGYVSGPYVNRPIVSNSICSISVTSP